MYSASFCLRSVQFSKILHIDAAICACNSSVVVTQHICYLSFVSHSVTQFAANFTVCYQTPCLGPKTPAGDRPSLCPQITRSVLGQED